MTIEEIERLLRRLERTDITTLEIADGTFSLRLRLAPGFSAAERGATLADVSASPAAARAILAGAIGRLRFRHPEAAPEPASAFPRAVLAGDIVAFLEAGTVLRPVVATQDCTIGPPLEAEGALIGYGTPLFPIV